MPVTDADGEREGWMRALWDEEGVAAAVADDALRDARGGEGRSSSGLPGRRDPFSRHAFAGLFAHIDRDDTADTRWEAENLK